MIRTLAALFCLLPATLSAQCAGTDLRDTLTADQHDALEAALADLPFAQGNHWLAEKDGQQLHLIGTMHLSDPRLDAPAARLAPLVEDAAFLLLEMDGEDQARLMKELSSNTSMLLLQGPTLPELMEEEDWQELKTAVEARGIPGFMAAKFQPWYLSMMLSLPPCAMAQITEQQGLDHKLRDVAEAAGVPTASLEPYDTIFRLFGAEPVEEQIAMLKPDLIDPEDADAQISTLLATYFEDSPAEGLELVRMLALEQPYIPREEIEAMYAQMESELIVNRNRAWIPVLTSVLEESDAPVVAAFGAAHLSGAEGVLALLADEGFTLTRQPF